MEIETAIRYLHMLEAIPSYPRKISVNQLHEKLSKASAQAQVSKRTIQRDLIKLSRHFPLVCDACSPRGWSRSAPLHQHSSSLGWSCETRSALALLQPIAQEHLPAHVFSALTPVFIAAPIAAQLADAQVSYCVTDHMAAAA
ncbi:MAG: hypothetical protein PHH87_07715 [Desulfuromonas sp.]|nr:hypothetical protein [Desulfuromonas sp.]